MANDLPFDLIQCKPVSLTIRNPMRVTTANAYNPNITVTIAPTVALPFSAIVRT